MTYDIKISEDVSLSKILDSFIIDNENPNIIVEFLKQHNNNLYDILLNSFCVDKIFQYDFIVRLDSNNYKWFLDSCYLISKDHLIIADKFAYLIWQIKQIHCNFKQNISSYSCDNNLISKYDTFSYNTKHPYSSRLSLCAKRIDSIIFQSNFYDISVYDAIKYVLKTDEDFKLNINNLIYSLHVGKIFQYDVFSQMTIVEKFILMSFIKTNLKHATNSSISLYCNYCYINFLKQIIEFDDNVEIVNFAIDIIKSVHYLFSPSVYYYDITIEINDFKNLLFECNSAEEFILMNTLHGVDITSNCLLYLINTKYSWFKKWISEFPNDLNQILNFKNIAA